MEKKYFGQGCVYFTGQWEDEFIAKEAGIDITQWTPVLVHCIHKENEDTHEGNCNSKSCPLTKKQSE